MKKIISLLVIALLLITTLNVNAMGSIFASDTIVLNGEKIGTWKDVRDLRVIGDEIFFTTSENTGFYNYKITNGNLEKLPNDYKYTPADFSNSDTWTISNHYSQNFYNTEKEYEYNGEKSTYEIQACKITVDGKTYGPYYEGNGYSGCDVRNMSNQAFNYVYVDDNSNRIWNIFTYFNETKSEIKANPTLDKALNKIFIKIDNYGEIKAQKVYKNLIIKIDSLLAKKQSAKNIELLNYIKYKVENKIQ